MLTQEDFKKPELYAKFSKKLYEVTISVPPIGTKVHNFLENADYVTSKEKPFVITGTVGEQWTVTEDKITKGYEVSAEDMEKIKRGESVPVWTKQGPNKDVVYAVMTTEDVKIKTSWGETLEAKAGDMIAAQKNKETGEPDFGHMYVINNTLTNEKGETVFMRTYQEEREMSLDEKIAECAERANGENEQTNRNDNSKNTER